MRRFVHWVGLSAALLIAPGVMAATVSFNGETGDTSGTGVSNLILLSLQGSGSESGSISWDGTDRVLTGDAQGDSRPVKVKRLNKKGIAADDLGILLNVNQPASGTGVNLAGFTLTALDASGATLWTAPFTGGTTTSNLTPVVVDGDGRGGYVFRVGLSDEEASALFASPLNRLGLSVDPASPITGNAGGPEQFSLVPVSSVIVGEPNPIPLPPAAWAGGMLLAIGFGVRMMHSLRRHA